MVPVSLDPIHRADPLPKESTVTSRKKLLLPILVLSLMGLPMKAQSVQSAATVLRCKASELSRHPFQCGGLVLTITRFKPDASIGNRTVSLQLANPTSGFTSFQPGDLIAVGADGHQAILCGFAESGVGQLYLHAPSASIRVAPGATLNLGYILEQSAKLPVKLYLDERLIAEITD